MDTGEQVMSSEKLTERPQVVAIRILDGGDTSVSAKGAKQWVNLPKDPKWVDKIYVTSKDRLGLKLRFKVIFNTKGVHHFKVKLVPNSSNINYSENEKSRNTNYNCEEAEKSYHTDANGMKIVEDEFFINAAGTNSYSLVAEDDDTATVTSQTVVAWRLVYYVEIKMRGLASIANDLNVMTAEFRKHNIEMLKLEDIEMEHIPNISRAEAERIAFLNKARSSYTKSKGPAKKPYAIAIVYTDHLAVKDSARQISKTGVDVGPGKPAVDIAIVDPLTTTTRRLWHNIVPGEDWFVSATFLKDGGVPGTDTVSLPKALCTRVPGTPIADKSSLVRVAVDSLPDGQGTISLTVNWVNMMRAGVSAGRGNVVCICTRAWWKDTDTQSQNQTMIHELGHQLHMVADGSGIQPDKVATYYDAKGHVGPHCHEGLPVKADYSNDSGTCVMFGATNGQSGFCPNCAPAVAKQDLSAGFPDF